ncbi:cytidylate kinase family protein [Candidatus Woesearchaeota archaeon]|nr:cytidylate kinase family protein [Candidatus Woesearchaeota archaeon]
MIITVTGFPGAGNTSLGMMLAKKLNYKFYSAGNMRKKMAVEHGMTLAEFNKLGEREDWTDKKVDNYLISVGKKEDNFVLDAKIGEYLVPDALKVFLKANLHVRAERVMKTKRKSEPFKTIEEAEKFLVQRVESDKKRYMKYYNHDAYNEKNFDLVLDTTNTNLEEEADIVLKEIRKKFK